MRLIFVLFLPIFLFFSAFNFCLAETNNIDKTLNIKIATPKDTDGDSYSDEIELKNGYSPFTKKPLKLEKSDADNDGLNDKLEMQFSSNPLIADTDSDGIKDGEAINKGFNPRDNKIKLEKKVLINLKDQRLYYYLGKIELGRFIVSTGKPKMPTPKGDFKIINKKLRVWSKKYGLWMPYWMGLANGSFGLHELPEWPNGYKEGQNHLGKAVSHGCVRLGIGDAKKLYDWTEVNTKVVIN